MRSFVTPESVAGQAVRLSAALALTVLLGAFPVAAAGQSGTAAGQPAAAADSQASAPADSSPSGFKWSWGNTLTYGLGFRVADPDKRLIGVAAGGTAFSVNGDDGIQNYEKGLFTNAAKITSEFEFSYKQAVGGFVRGFAFYDFVNQNGDRARTPLTDAAKDRVGARAEFRDAFLWWRFKAGSRAGEIRGGWQVINWGESTFIQGGINAVNPVDVSVLRVPGAELRDALLPVGADRRLPMREIYQMFRGALSPDDVLAAGRADPSAQFYAELYVGLYYEAYGDEARARRHLRIAASKQFAAFGYMHRVAELHPLVREP